MSEYQYYEFQAIDRPLDDKARTALRQISSRAEISATSLTNEYHFGNFKGDPRKLMEQYFDAHLYFANWGSRDLMLRVPLAGLALAEVEPYHLDPGLDAWATANHLILHWSFGSDDGDWDYDADEGTGSLASMVLIRDELMNGDRRPLYLGWLLSIQQMFEDEEEDTFEPPVPPGLKTLSGPQRALVDFLQLDDHLLAAAAERSADRGKGEDAAAEAEQEAWVKGLPAADKDAYLMRLLQGEGALVGVELRRQFRDARLKMKRKDRSAEASGPKPRSVAALRARAEELLQEEQERQRQRRKREQEKEKRRQEEQRERHLATLVGREESLWQQVEALVTAKVPKKYDEAVAHLLDLQELARRAGTTADFGARVQGLRERHASKRTFLERLDSKQIR